jgi:hypothetical protein
MTIAACEIAPPSPRFISEEVFFHVHGLTVEVDQALPLFPLFTDMAFWSEPSEKVTIPSCANPNVPS